MLFTHITLELIDNEEFCRLLRRQLLIKIYLSVYLLFSDIMLFTHI